MILKNLCKKISLLIISVVFFSCVHHKSEIPPRQKVKIDFDWTFSKGDFPEAKEQSFDDSKWEKIDVPHDWSISDTFSEDNPTGNPGGFASGGIGWYRKALNLEGISKDSKVSIEFGGVYMNSEVWINGNYLGKRPYGFISFNYDLTPYLNFDGENVLAVRVDNSKQPNARWYTGSGIYRHVWLIATNKLHIARHGVFATTKINDDGSATVEIGTSAKNEYESEQLVTLKNELYSPSGDLVAEFETTGNMGGKAAGEIVHNLSVETPELWSPDQPNLYKLKTILSIKKKVVDVLETNVGMRSFSFSADNGFTLNGKSMKFQGVNNHSDLGALGAAINEQVMHRRLKILKEMGCNAIRTAHNPPCDELLNMCDSMGFMVMDEAFDEWLESWPFGGVKKPEGKSKYGYHLYFNEWAEKDLTELIKRDRNHPSVIIWSVGNEIPDACFEVGVERLNKLIDVVRKNDPTRPVTCGITHMHLANETGFASALDITGYNGGGGSCFMYEADHETYPERKFIATEVPHSFQTRGVYRTQSWYRGLNPLGGIMKVPNLTEEEVFPDHPKYYSSSYDNAMVRIGARDSWRRTRDFDYMAGEFRWTGFDYLGESMFGWPAKLWNFGIIDMCGFPKDTYYFYKSQWTEEPMVHIFPHWSWEGKEGVEIPVVAYSNCESVELFLNGKSLGEKSFGDNMDVVWNVTYEPGTLLAKGKKAGAVCCEMKIETAGDAAKIEMLADKETITTNRHDVVHLEVNVVDAKDRFVPEASNKISFKVEGDSSILGIDNGDPMNQASFVGNEIAVFKGKCLLIVKSNGKPGEITVTAESEGLETAVATIQIK